MKILDPRLRSCPTARRPPLRRQPRSQTVGTGSCWVPHTAAVIADVKPSWYILSYEVEVLNDEAEALTGADGGDVQNLEMQLFLKKHYLHPVAYRVYGHSGYALSLWIRGAHAKPPTEKKKSTDQDCYRKH